MAEPRPDRLRSLFDAALEQAPAERAAFLAQQCGDDPALQQRVLRLIAGAEADEFLAGTTTGAGADAASAGASPDLEVGARIGPYELVGQLGEGGFGVVFLARQLEPVARSVALKIVKLGMDTRQVIARFEQERQALALMDHPNIAKVFDAGTTPTGRPFFVMELVQGAPIVAFCDRERLGVPERLALFVQVCRAVQHAHGKGIVHRDLKPSNVLVARQDGAPVAKVIDFGVAKATARSAADSLLTQHQQVLGTLQYMSPEQAAGSDDVDTRTDVWALGVLLYELLTGTTPLPKQQLAAAMFGELSRLLQEVDPPRPSSRLEQSGDDLAAIAERRGSEPRRLGTLVRGDLDWIVMKALEKDRTRRYATVDGFAADVERHLAGEPVLAAPPSASYRLQKLLRRHRGAVTAAAATLLALVLGLVLFAWQANVAAKERDLALQAQRNEATQRALAVDLATAEATQRQRAERQQAKATAINRFLLEMLGAADVRRLGRDATVAQALERAAATVDRSLADQPEVRAAVHHVLAEAFLSLGLIDAAAPQIEAAMQTNERLHGEASAEFVECLDDLAELQRQRGDHTAEEATLRRAVELALRLEPEAPFTVATARLLHANALRTLDRLDEAERGLRAALAQLEALVGEEHGQTVVARNSLAVLLHQTKRLDEAEALYRETLAIARRRFGDEHVDTLVAEMNLAGLLADRLQLDVARPMFEHAYQGLVRAYGDTHLRTAEAAWRLGKLHYDAGEPREALPCFERCLRIRLVVQGEDALEVVETREFLAHSANRLGDHDRALAEFQQVRTIRRLRLGEDHEQSLQAWLHLANTLVKAGRKDEAAVELAQALARCEQVLGADSATTAVATNSYAVLLLGLERHADAVPFLEKALANGRRVAGLEHRDTLITQINLLQALRDSGRTTEAIEVGRDVLPRLLRSFGEDHDVTGFAHGALGEALARAGRLDDAVAEHGEALRVARLTSRPGHPDFGGEALLLARVQIARGAFADASALLAEVETAYPVPHRFAHAAAAERGLVAVRQGRFPEAVALLLAAERELAALTPPRPRDVARVRDHLSACYAAWQAHEPSAERAAAAQQWAERARAR